MAGQCRRSAGHCLQKRISPRDEVFALRHTASAGGRSHGQGRWRIDAGGHGRRSRTRGCGTSGSSGAKFERVAEAVGWLGAVQAQDYGGAKWGLAQRVKGCADGATWTQAFERGEILRTHVLRPTWHFVLPADIRWLLALTAPRVKAGDRRTTGSGPGSTRARFARRRSGARGARCAAAGTGRAPSSASCSESAGIAGGGRAARAAADARRARRADLQRAAPRQAVHLCAARRAGAGGDGAAARAGAGGAVPRATSRATARRRRRTSPGGRA